MTSSTNLEELAGLVERITQGEWHATNHFDDDSTPCNCSYILSEGYAGSICEISVDNGLAVGDGGNDAPPRDEAAANAHLIALAPELAAEVLRQRDTLDSLSAEVRGLSEIDEWAKQRAAKLSAKAATHIKRGKSLDDPDYRVILGEHKAYLAVRSFVHGSARKALGSEGG